MTAAVSSKSEYVALAEVVNELRFLSQMTGFLTPPIDDTIVIREDNEGSYQDDDQPFQQQTYEARVRETPHCPLCGREWCSLNPLRQMGGATCRCADESVGRQHL